MGNIDRVWILLAKKKAGEASAAELLELDRLMEQQESGHASEVIDKIWEAPLTANPDLRPEARVWEKLERHISQPGTYRFLHWTMGRWVAAASLITVVVSAAILFGGHKKTNGPEPITANGPNLYSTQPGSKSKLELPDGTQVWLNGNSKLTVAGGRAGAGSREVYLSGEAFFDVARNEKVPFRIHTGTIDITVLGTAFNVKAYPDDKNVETALVRGLIEITTHLDPDRKIILKPNEKIIIPAYTAAAGMRGLSPVASSVYAISALHESKSGVLADTVWMQRKLEFDNEPFSELAPKMEVWFDIRIRFGNETIKNKRFSGVIEKETLEETLKDMQLSAPFTYSIGGNELLIN
jgi:ferric-dicitrate binding protein FerR (iron transport regulator)